MTNEGQGEQQKSMDSDPSEERFISHYVSHQRAIHSFIMTIVPSAVDADEILQEASITMFRKFDQFKEGTSFRNWAFQVAKFTAFNHLRQVKRDRLVFEPALVELIAKDVSRFDGELNARKLALKHCRAKLPKKDSEVLTSCYSGRQTINQYSKSVGRTPNAIYKQLDRIRRDLLKCIRRVAGELNAEQ